MELGIALDGEGRLGRPAAVAAVASAADQLGYSSIWCIGPWAETLAGAVAVSTERVRIGLETPSSERATRAICGDRLVVADLPAWSGGARSPQRIDIERRDLVRAARVLAAARAAGVAEVVVRLVDDPGVDDALATYARLAELAAGPPSA